MNNAERLCQVRRNGFQQFDDIVCDEQLLAEGVQPFHLHAAPGGIAGLAPDPLGKMAGDDRGTKKSGQGNPVLLAGDGESAYRRQKEEVKADRR